MFDSLNKYGLPTKFAIIGLVGGLIGAFISHKMQLNDGSAIYYVGTPIAAAMGGAIGGWFKDRDGKQS